MKKLLIGVASLALLFFLAAPKTHAITPPPQWNVSGTWHVTFDYLGTDYTHDMTLAQNASGTLTGSGGYPAGGPHTYAWTVDSGALTGNAIHLDTHYTLGTTCSMTLDGVVASTTGAMSGTWSDNCWSLSRSGTWTTTSGTATPIVTPVTLAAPTLLSPVNGYSTTTAGFTKADWTDVTDPFMPITYIFQSSHSSATNPDGSFVTPVYTSGPLSVSEIATNGTPVGTYYWHVKAVDASSTSSVWSSTWSVTVVDNTPVTLAAPTPLSPANGYSTTTAGLTKIDWTDVTDPFMPITYIYQSSHSSATNPDGSFVTPLYTSGPLSVSEIAANGTPAGTYYWHVRAVDASSTSSVWSTTWSVIVDNTPVVVPPTTPTNKDQCKNGGWRTFTNPSFRNQGQCVSWTNHQ